MSNHSLVISAQQLILDFANPIKGGAPIHAVRGIDIAVQRGHITALVGPDGAGKTSFMRLCAGLIAPTLGALNVLGHNLHDTEHFAAQAQSVQNRISYMPQRFGLYEDLSVRENFELYADLHGVSMEVRQARYDKLMHMTDMSRFADRLAGKLSGGMKQKLGLMCTLVRSPELLLLDEPTVGVDPLSRRELWHIVQQMIADEQLTVLLATTYLDEAEQCAEVYVMFDGQVLAQGNPDALTKRAEGLCYMARTNPQSKYLYHNRLLQANLFDHKKVTLDAVPQNGAVRLIRHPQASEDEVRALLDGGELSAVSARLEDGVMVVMRDYVDSVAAVNVQEALSESPQRIPESTAAIPANNSNEPANEPVIEVRNLVRQFGDFTAVANTTFDVRRGEIFGLLGPNGAGKTTTFRMLCGLLPASSGDLRVAGVNLRSARALARAKVGYVSQKFSLYGNLSVRENLQFFGQAYGLYGKKLQQRMDEVLQQFGLMSVATHSSKTLAGGYKQRLAMAVGLIHEPEVLFLDEPTSGADALARRDFWRQITDFALAGTTIIITTHFMEEAEYCDRMVIQDAGQILALGTPDEVRRNAGDARTMDEAFIGTVEQARAHKDAGRAHGLS